MNIQRPSNKTIIKLAVFTLITFLYCFFRLKSIYFQNVGYTYDQGRDFLKAAEIVLYKNPTFIGPTTGIQGIFHGAWWYYFLALVFMITGGIPIGFYYANFIVHLLSFLIFYYAAKRLFGFITASILSFLIATSGYFMFTSVFLGNNVLAMPAFLAVLICSIYLINKQYSIRLPIKKYPLLLSMHLIAGLALGFVAEFEFAFGLLLIPIYLLIVALFHFFSRPFKTIKHYIYFIVGFAIPFGPRFLFELKNGFPQTKTLINFVIKPSYYTPKPYWDIYRDRLEVFDGFYKATFMSDTVRIIIVSLLLIFIAYRIYIQKVSMKKGFWFVALTVALLFGISTLYKDTFWSYYYEGLPYAFLLIGGFILTLTGSKHDALLQKGKLIVLGILLMLGTVKFFNEWKQPLPYDGIRVQQDIVAYIQSQEKDLSNYCILTYTPPVIPYTYDYIFLYNEVSRGVTRPSPDFKNGHCWFILEADDNKERKQDWIDQHISTDLKQVQTKRIKDVDIELWKQKSSDEK